MDLLLLQFLILIWAAVGAVRCVGAPRSRANVIFLIVAVAAGGTAGVYLLGHASRLLAGAPQPPGTPPTNALSLFAADLVHSPDNTVRASDGLQPPEGPFPQWDLPKVRWARKPSIQLRIPAKPGLTRLRLSFSVRLYVRENAEMEVRLNDRAVQRYQLTGASNWLDQSVELAPGPGAIVLEFRDVTLQTKPDWQDYLRRYPDVMKHLVTHNLQLEQGALEHYRTHGQLEGRTMLMVPESGQSFDSYYFMFRTLRLEELGAP